MILVLCCRGYLIILRKNAHYCHFQLCTLSSWDCISRWSKPVLCRFLLKLTQFDKVYREGVKINAFSVAPGNISYVHMLRSWPSFVYSHCVLVGVVLSAPSRTRITFKKLFTVTDGFLRHSIHWVVFLISELFSLLCGVHRWGIFSWEVQNTNEANAHVLKEDCWIMCVELSFFPWVSGALYGSNIITSLNEYNFPTVTRFYRPA